MNSPRKSTQFPSKTSKNWNKYPKKIQNKDADNNKNNNTLKLEIPKSNSNHKRKKTRNIITINRTQRLQITVPFLTGENKEMQERQPYNRKSAKSPKGDVRNRVQILRMRKLTSKWKAWMKNRNPQAVFPL